MGPLLALLLLGAAAGPEQVIPVTAKKLDFTPAVIELRVVVRP